MKKMVILAVIYCSLAGCAMVQDQRQAMTAKEGSWQQYTQSIPMVDLPVGMRAGSLQSFYRIPSVKRSNRKAPARVDGVFLPPQVQ